MSVDKTLREEAAKRILVLDGAMGTMIQEYKLDEAGYRGARFDAWNREVRGNNDLLNLSQPKAVRDIHLAYFRAGADIVSTNTFSSTSIAQADYGMQDIAYELNFEGARLVRAAALTAENEDRPQALRRRRDRPDQPHGVDLAGCVQSRLPRHHVRPAARGLRRAGARPARRRRGSPADRDDLRHAQRQGGDPRDPRRDRGARRARAGHDLRHDHRHVRPAAVRSDARRHSGIRSATRRRFRSGSTARSAPRKCARTSRSSGASPIRWSARIRTLACRMSSGSTTKAPNSWRNCSASSPRSGLVNIVGGCCGTTPAHIRAIAEVVKDKPPRQIPEIEPLLRLSGLESLRAHERNSVRQCRRAHQRHRLGEIPQADHGGRLQRRACDCARPGRERRAGDRRQHGRRPARVRAGDGHVPQSDRERARHRARAGDDRFIEVQDHRGRPEMRAGQGGRQLDLDERGRGRVHQAREGRAPPWRRRRRDGVRREGPGRHVRSARPRSARAPTRF